MDFKDTLSKIDAVLGPKTITFKSKAAAEAYVQSQLAKAKEESEEKDKEEGATKAKKRLAHLRESLSVLAKASWEGQANSITIPVYEGGFEDTTAKSELTETEQKTPPAGNSGTQGAGSPIAGAGGAQSFNDAKSTGGGGQGGTPSIAGTAADGQSFAAGGGAQGFAKSIADLAKSLEGLNAGNSTGEGRAQTKKNEQDFAFPRDMTEPKFMKEGIHKRGEIWGTDDEKSPV